MLYVVNTKFSSEIGNVFSGIKGTWGMPFWAATTSFLGIYSTMIINASDYSRNATDEEIQKCIDWVKQGRVNLKFKAIFIDEVQIFDPLYLELCYSLLE